MATNTRQKSGRDATDVEVGQSMPERYVDYSQPETNETMAAYKARLREYFAEIGRKGGQKSRRKLTKAQARAMVRARTAKRAALRPNDKLRDAAT